MPLLDHFQPPLSQRRHWDSFHGAWAEAIARLLNQTLLPEKFVVEARVKLGGLVEVQLTTPGQGVNDLYASAHRTVPGAQDVQLEPWAFSLSLGGWLPTLPLWIQPDRCLPLDLKATDHAGCVARRIAS